MDAVLFSSMVTASLGMLLCRSFRRQGIVAASIAHGKDVTQKGPYQWLLVRRILRSLDAVMPVSRATGAQCIRRGMPECRVHVVPNGVQLDRFFSAQRQSRGDTFVLCSVGRLVRRKGFAWFIQSVMPQLPSNVHYFIGGSGPEGPAIAAAIQEGALSDRVHLLGQLSEDELVSLYVRADLLIVPNVPVQGDMEGFGIVMLEAGACGAPAVASRLEGIQDVITEGVNGHLVECQDAAAFTHAIMRYVDDTTALLELSTRTRDHTQAHFQWDAIAARYLAVLDAEIHRPV